MIGDRYSALVAECQPAVALLLAVKETTESLCAVYAEKTREHVHVPGKRSQAMTRPARGLAPDWLHSRGVEKGRWARALSGRSSKSHFREAARARQDSVAAGQG